MLEECFKSAYNCLFSHPSKFLSWLWVPSYRGNGFTNRYPSNSPINRISMVSLHLVHLKISTEIYVEDTSVNRLSLSNAVPVVHSGSRNVTSDRSRSVKIQVGTSQINSLASSGFTEQHAPSSEPQWKASTPSSLPSSNTVRRLRLQLPGHHNQQPTSNSKSSTSSFA
jgi:hypothetical protein